MVKPLVPTADDAATRWADITAGRSTRYEEKAVGKGSTWEANGKAAAGTFKAAVAATDIDKRFAGGIKRVGGAKFDRKVKDVGVSRFSPGVTAAKVDYQGQVAWVLTEIGATDIGVRKPRGDAANYARSSAIGTALNKKRLALMAAGAA